MEIKDINDEYCEMATSFLKKSSKINKVNKEILKNGSGIIEEDKILGLMSYEIFDDSALVRYFIIRLDLDFQVVEKLMNEITNKLKKKNVKRIFAIIDNQELKKLFLRNNFIEIDNKNIFIEENKMSNTQYKYSYVLYLNLN